MSLIPVFKSRYYVACHLRISFNITNLSYKQVTLYENVSLINQEICKTCCFGNVINMHVWLHHEHIIYDFKFCTSTCLNRSLLPIILALTRFAQSIALPVQYFATRGKPSYLQCLSMACCQQKHMATAGLRPQVSQHGLHILELLTDHVTMATWLELYM